MQEFRITLKNEKISLYNRISWLIIIINLILIAYLSFFSTYRNIRGANISALILFSLLLFYYFYLKKTIWAIGLHPLFFLLMTIWIINEYYWLAGLIFIFDLLHTIATAIQVISISKKKISYHSLFKKSTDWDKLNNLILKDGLLTIDFKNNKIIQQPIDENKTSVDEKEFNEFCRQQLNVKQVI